MNRPCVCCGDPECELYIGPDELADIDAQTAVLREEWLARQPVEMD